jgi:hypothetical protein
MGDSVMARTLEAHLKTYDEAKPRVFSRAAFISYRGDIGFVYCLGENWGGDWRSGDVAVLWSNGDLTVLPEDDFRVLSHDAWTLAASLEVRASE